MFERFTEQARQVVVFAQDESRQLKHGYIDTDHLLLALLRVDESNVLLSQLGVTLEAARDEVRSRLGEGDHTSTGQIPFTPEAKKALELSLRAALDLNEPFIAPAHIVLGLAGTDGGRELLDDLDVDVDALRDDADYSPARRGPRWEYRIEHFVDLDGDWLTSFGRDGWELAAVVPAEVSRRAIFKRKA